MGKPATSVPDPFLRRLVGGAVVGCSVLIGGYAAYFAFVRGPALRELLLDFDAAPARVSNIALTVPWLPLAVAVAAAALGAAAMVSLRKVWLAAAVILTLLAAGLCLAFEVVAAWPVDRLIRSINP